MRRIRVLLAVVAATCLLGSSFGCTSTTGPGDYYGREPVEPAFPPGYAPGGHIRYGRPQRL